MNSPFLNIHLNPHTILPIFTMSLAIICGVFVIHQNPRAKLNRLFLAICFTFTLWFSFYIPYNFDINEDLLITWYRISYCFISFIPILCFTFITTYLNISRNRIWFRINSLIGLTFAILSVTTDWIIKGISYYPWHPYPHAGIVHPLLIFHCMYLSFSSTKLMIDALKNSLLSPKARNHLKYMLSAIISLSVGATDFIGNYNLTIYEIGYIPVSAYLIITTIAIFKYQLMDIKVVFKRSLIYTLLITIITIMYLISIFLTEHIVQSVFGYQSLLISMGWATVIAVIFIPLKNIIQGFVEKLFFKGSYVQIAEENELLRQEIIRSERMRSVATLASGMAHEIKNPLTPLKTFAEQLPNRMQDKEFLKKFSKIIICEVNRIDALVQELLDFARPTTPQFKITDIHQLLNHTLDFLNNDFLKHKIILNKDYQLQTNIPLHLDSRQIQQGLLNIFLNAIESMSTGGFLFVRTSLKNRYLIEITIKDNGTGISSEDIAHIFDPFFTKKDHGTGLGLAITYEIIKNHNGKIFVESTVGKGSTFIIQLPVKI